MSLSPRPPFFHIFFGRGIVIMPTVARTTAGYSLDVEPVAAVPLSQPEAIRTALTDLIARGNPEIPAPARGEYVTPVYPYAGVKSWPAFTKKFLCIAFTREDDEFKIEFTTRDARGQMIDDPLRTKQVPHAELVTEVLGHVLSSHQP